MNTVQTAIPRPCKVISGFQTGVDIGAIRGANQLGLRTGGYMPKGWCTERGPMPSYACWFGAVEHESPLYPPRTEANVRSADVTIIISVIGVPERGSTLTEKLCQKLGSPYARLNIPNTKCLKAPYIERLHFFLEDLESNDYTVNFAGNRESISPGIEEWTQSFVLQLFG